MNLPSQALQCHDRRRRSLHNMSLWLRYQLSNFFAVELVWRASVKAPRRQRDATIAVREIQERRDGREVRA